MTGAARSLRATKSFSVQQYFKGIKMKLTIKQVKDGVPIWDIFDTDDNDVGCMTNFPGEGLMATVHLVGQPEYPKATVLNRASIHETYMAATHAYNELLADVADPSRWDFTEQDTDHIEDEDGSIAAMRQAELRAERSAERDHLDWGFGL